MERTLVLIKPDGVEKNIIGDILARYEHKGLKIVALKLVKVSEAQAKFHYAEHEGKGFFGELISFITSAPLIAAVVEGQDAIKAVRQLNGATNPLEAVPGSIRGDYAIDKGMNIVHGSDSPEAAAREINNFFAPEEVY